MEQDNDKEFEFSGNGKGSDTAELVLVKAAYDTPPDKMSEMTDIPLDQVRPLSMMTVYAEEVKLLCDAMKTAQKWYSDNWTKWHNGEVEINIDKHEEYDTKKLMLLSKEWLQHYYKLRRSIRGEHRMGAITLAQDQIAAKTEALSSEDLLDRMLPQ